MNVRSAGSSRLAWQRFFARTDFVPSKTSISRRSRPGSAGPFKDLRLDILAFMLSTLSTNESGAAGHRSVAEALQGLLAGCSYVSDVRTGIELFGNILRPARQTQRGCQSSTRFPSGSVSQPNFPKS